MRRRHPGDRVQALIPALLEQWQPVPSETAAAAAQDQEVQVHSQALLRQGRPEQVVRQRAGQPVPAKERPPDRVVADSARDRRQRFGPVSNGAEAKETTGRGNLQYGNVYGFTVAYRRDAAGTKGVIASPDSAANASAS